MRSRRLMIAAVAALLACPAGLAPAQLAPPSGPPTPGAPTSTRKGPPSDTPAGPTLRLGALVPLTGAGAWFGAEIKQGLELAAAELKPLPPRAPSLAGGIPDAPAPPDE